MSLVTRVLMSGGMRYGWMFRDSVTGIPYFFSS